MTLEFAQEDDWVCVHTFLDAGHDELITGALRPLVAKLTADGLVERWFFLRYWEGGPHVRARFLPRRREDREIVRERAVRALRAFVAANPVPDLVDRTKFAENATGLAALEGRDGHDMVLRPNNTVELFDYRRETEDYGRDAAITAVERHFHESSVLALRVIAAGATQGQRANVAFDLVVGTFAMCDDLRDRWPAIAAMPTPFGTGEESPGVREQYERQRDALRDRLLATWRLADRVELGETVAGGHVEYWLKSLHALRERLASLEDAGTFVSAWRDSPLAGPLGLDSARHPGTTLVLLRCAHLVVNRMGLSLWEEAQVRYLVGYVLKDHPQLLVRS